MNKRILRVGFDLDGVILYNPIRIFRPFTSIAKTFIFGAKSTGSFYFPKSSLEKYIWKQLHRTSFRIAPGMQNLKTSIKKNNIKAYIITSRYSFLKNEFEDWMKKIDAKKYFRGCYYNKTDLQPNEFKKEMIEKLDLDIFVEDNWGVVQKINHRKKTKIFWITNLLDRNIPYKYKYDNLKQAVQALIK